MSIQSFVFLKQKQLPTLQQLLFALDYHQLPLELPDGLDLSTRQLITVDSSFKKLPCVFDYALADYKDKDWGWSENDAQRFDDVEVVAMFNCYSNAQEIMGLMIVSCLLAAESNGVLFSPVFRDELILAEHAMAFFSAHHAEIESQFNGVSKLR